MWSTCGFDSVIENSIRTASAVCSPSERTACSIPAYALPTRFVSKRPLPAWMADQKHLVLVLPSLLRPRVPPGETPVDRGSEPGWGLMDEHVVAAPSDSSPLQPFNGSGSVPDDVVQSLPILSLDAFARVTPDTGSRVDDLHGRSRIGTCQERRLPACIDASGLRPRILLTPGLERMGGLGRS